MPQLSTDRKPPRPKSLRTTTVRKAVSCMVAVLTLLTVTAGTPADVGTETPASVSTVNSDSILAQPVRSLDDFLQDPIFNGKFSLDVRLRAEVADQDGLQTSQAYTVRTRLGYTSDTENPLYFHVELEDTRAADEDQYNAAGFSGQPTKTVIADPEATELNQAFIHYNLKDQANTFVRFGRQRIKLDDDRFIGNVGWRQNEQTYDAILFGTTPVENVDFIYSYIWRINRIFDPDDGVNFDSDSHVFHLSYDDETLGKITVFAYLLDVAGTPGAGAFSSNTYGVRYEATRDLNGQKLNYVLSYANQVDAAANTTNYQADYFLINVKLIQEGWYVGAAWESLGSDDGKAAFQTPLATGHAFNGWADVFLTTPVTGLEDTYIYVGGDLPEGFKGKAVYHWFQSEEGGTNFGNEFDVVVSKKLTDHATVLAKYARYDGEAAFADISRFWLQLELAY